MPELNEPVEPDVLSPEPHEPIAGDYADDDAAVIDETLEAPSYPPLEYGGEPYTTDTLLPVTRLLVRTVVLPVGSDPVQVFPADRLRRNFTIQCSGTGIDGIIIAGNKSDVYGLATAMDCRAPITIPEYTGAIWVYSTDAADPATVTVWCVTE